MPEQSISGIPGRVRRFRTARVLGSAGAWAQACALAGSLSVVVFLAGCVTVPRTDLTNYGPFPDNYESIVETAVQSWPKEEGVTRTVTSIKEPSRRAQEDMAGWAVRAKIRESRPNNVGGTDITEREYQFLLRDGRVLMSDRR